MVTGSDSRQDVDAARCAGAAGYVTKDKIAAELIGAIFDVTAARRYPVAVLQFVAVLQVLLSIALIGLILMHSGRDTGFGGMGFTPASQGGTHIVERNLTRLTVRRRDRLRRDDGCAVPPALTSRVRGLGIVAYRESSAMPDQSPGPEPAPVTLKPRSRSPARGSRTPSARRRSRSG